jgi:hypothetical protein
VGDWPRPTPYSLAFNNTAAVVTIQSTPKPIVLSMKPDGTLLGTGGEIQNNPVVVVIKSAELYK